MMCDPALKNEVEKIRNLVNFLTNFVLIKISENMMNVNQPVSVNLTKTFTYITINFGRNLKFEVCKKILHG